MNRYLLLHAEPRLSWILSSLVALEEAVFVFLFFYFIYGYNTKLLVGWVIDRKLILILVTDPRSTCTVRDT